MSARYLGAMSMTEAELESLVGHRFPGGTDTIDRWENFLLTDCTGRDQLEDDLVHPIALFHVPILGAGTSIAELFELAKVEGAGSVGLDGYDWEYFTPLRTGVEYRFEGGIVGAERHESKGGRRHDTFVFSIDVIAPDGSPAARVTNYWRLHR